MTLQIKYSCKFKSDLKKYKQDKSILKDINNVLKSLSEGKALSEKFKDHPLIGNFKGRRECHIRPDLLLIYQIDNIIEVLYLERLGSHSELFK
jgi:mRNA interferase YafQ